ncbi:MAG: chemotaxis protein CheW [Gammaproteobacteria bacterium]|nr:chemotaxis protein CheW [Gammaproteobacteria bacterium]
MPIAQQDALSLLHQMQTASRRSAPGLPEQVQAAPQWTGLGFRLGDLQYVTPLSHVSEVLPLPAITPVPGTRRWVKGIANVRGNLYTIIDLPEFFGKEPVQFSEAARMLIMNIPELHAALVVNQVMGLRHFDKDKERQDITGFSDPSLTHARGAFLQDNVLWGVFDMHSLAESMEFKHVAA